MALGTAVFCLLTANLGAPWWIGLLAALAAIALIVGIAGFDLTRPAHQSLSEKQHNPSGRIS